MELTKAQKHNRMLETTFNHYNAHQNSLPCEQLMNSYKRIATEKKISMKTKQILSEKEFITACKSKNNTTVQNHAYLYFDFGTYGAKLVNAKTSKQKVVNFYREFDYNSFCACMDEQTFE